MKPSRITLITFFVLLSMAGTLFIAVGMERQVTASYDTEITMQQTLSAVGRLEVCLRALRSDSGQLENLVNNWTLAREEFGRTLRRLAQLQESIGAQRITQARLAELWARIEEYNRETSSILVRMQARNHFEGAGDRGLTLYYRRMLEDHVGERAEVGDLGLLLYNLELTNVLVKEVENELRQVQGDLRERTVGKLGLFNYLGLTIIILAIFLVAWLLFRLARLYSAMQDDNQARRAAEDAARRSESDLRGILDSIGEAVLAVSPDGQLQRINPAAEALLLWTKAEASGRSVSSLFTLVPVAGRGGVVDPIGQVLKGGRSFVSGDSYVLTRRDGSERSVSVLATPICREVGRLAGVVVAIRDMSDRQWLEEQLRRTQRLESIGQLAGGVAHDFNNFLQVVHANIDLLRLESGVSDDGRECVGQIDAAAQRASGLTRQLLAFGRRQMLQMRQADPLELVQNILSLIRRVIGENIEIQFHPESPLSFVCVDPGQFEQVVMNLCVNARDAMPKGGRLVIGLRNQDFSETQLEAYPGTKQGTYVVLSVSDNGHGMSASVLARIFEPFYTTKPQGAGTGLGLSVVQGIIQQHGGFIHVLSEPDFGTCFSVHLPAQAAGVAPVKQESALGDPVFKLGADRLILVAEDEPLVRQAARQMLMRLGYRVVEAGDGLEACQLVAKHGAELSLVMLDAIMPKLGGLDAAQEICRLRPGLPILLCTGYTGGINLSEDKLNAGMVLLQKPYTSRELAECLASMIPD